jgi:hypothetical protein
MKFQIVLKDPDGVWESLKDAFDTAEDPFVEIPTEQLRTIEKFVEFGEYVTIEIDTELKTAKVVPV